MFTVIWISAACFAILWVGVVQFLGDKTQYVLARYPFLFLLLHIPVMFLLATILGEGLIAGLGSLAGGIVGQMYLAVLGMRKWKLSFFGKKTEESTNPFGKKARKRKRFSKKRYKSLLFE